MWVFRMNPFLLNLRINHHYGNFTHLSFFKKAMWGITNREKMLSRYPGVLFTRMGVGSEILDFVKMWFDALDNKTACRFIIVDAKNEPKVLCSMRKMDSLIFSHQSCRKISIQSL